ncbi:MAG: deoxyribose-phosphate aldolase [Planctomycetes bacterium]|nr:deoxyribose-phosphate aldolase [Planctomycetota bacterium]
MNLQPSEIDALAERIVGELLARKGPPAPNRNNTVCSNCVGNCVKQCAFKLDDFIAAGAARLGASLGVGTPKPGIAAFIDHTLLKADATEREVDQLCAEAAQHGFASVCVNPVFIERCRRNLANTSVKTCTVIGFPLGATLSRVKAAEARLAQELGAEELDMVIPVGLLKSGRHDLVAEDIAAVVAACTAGNVLKVIIETCLLTDDEKRAACRIAAAAGADYVKTSTGFAGGGATAHDVALMRAEVGPVLGVKASGGVKDLAAVQAMVAAGATRIGASAGVRIVKEASA